MAGLTDQRLVGLEAMTKPGADTSPRRNGNSDLSSEVIEDFLVDLAERLALRPDSETIRAVMQCACAGQMQPCGPNGAPASLITPSGIPFDVSVSGGRGKISPTLRYTTEAKTQQTRFAPRIAAQLAAISDLVEWLPDEDNAAADTLVSFVRTLYPDLSKVPVWHRSATWIGIVQHAAAPRQIARLKVYSSLALPGALDRLCSRWSGFTGLVPSPDRDGLINPHLAALEVDAFGNVNHKIYLKARRDIGVPMKLVHYFGDPAWEVLSELVRCGVDAAGLHGYDYFVCCERSTHDPAVTLYVCPRPGDDLSTLVHELASRHHGSTSAVDALPQAAESCGLGWQYTGAALSHSASGFGKLNIYGVPVLNTARGSMSRPLGARSQLSVMDADISAAEASAPQLPCRRRSEDS